MMKTSNYYLGFLFLLVIIFYSSHKEATIGEEETEIDSIERSNYDRMMRGGDINPENYARALRYFKDKRNYKQPGRDAGIMGWEELGPMNVGGRVRGFATHPTDPDILWCGGTSGGLWKSTNAGTSWQILDNFWSSMAVTSILIHPLHQDTMYVATGEGYLGGKKPGDGIFKTYDGGQTWNNEILLFHDYLGNKEYWVNKLVWDPNNYSNFFAVTTNGDLDGTNNNGGSLFRIKLDGNSSDSLFGVDPTLRDIFDVDVDPNDSDYIIISGLNGSRYTTDGGANWFNMSGRPGFPVADSLNRVEIAFAPSNSDIIYAATQKNQEVYKSVNGGLMWTKINSQTYDFYATSSGGNVGGYANTIWVSPLNSERLIIGGLNLFRSLDGGVTFTRISDNDQYYNGLSVHADQHIIVEAADFSASNKKIYIGSDGGIASTTNFVAVSQTFGWNLLNGNSLGITQFYNSNVSSDGSVIMGGTQDNGTQRSTDGGQTWSRIHGGDGGYCAVSKQDKNLLYFSSQNGNFYNSVNGGALTCKIFSFNNSDGNCAPVLVDEGANFIAPLEINPNNGLEVYIGGKRLIYSDDAGNTWAVAKDSLANGSNINLIHVAEADSSNVWVGHNNGQIFKTETAGTSWIWTELTANISNTNANTAIETHPNDADVVMIAKAGFETNNVWYSDNGGTTFSNRSAGFPPVNTSAVGWHPNNEDWCYVGTDLGLMSSEDAGLNWSITPLSNDQDGPVTTQISSIFWADNNLHLGTFGRGIWKSTFAVQEKIYIDNTCIGSCGCGTQACPHLTIADALAHAGHGSTIVIAGGTDYDISNQLILEKRINIETTGASVIIR